MQRFSRLTRWLSNFTTPTSADRYPLPVTQRADGAAGAFLVEREGIANFSAKTLRPVSQESGSDLKTVGMFHNLDRRCCGDIRDMRCKDRRRGGDKRQVFLNVA
jgi:hypothetical protein